MKGVGQARRLLLACGAAAAFALVAAPAIADRTIPPTLWVITGDQTLNHASGVDLEVFLVAGAPAAESMAFTVPAGYRMTTAAVGTELGSVELEAQPAAGGSTTRSDGTIVAADPAALATNPQVQVCAPGTHGSAWNLVFGGLTIPVAIDQLSSGGSYRIVACLDALRASNLKPVVLDLGGIGVFVNPTAPATYVWSAVVTAFNAVGAPDPTTAFEVRSDEPLPETLSLKASVKKTTLTLSGKLLGGGRPRGGVRIELAGGPTPLVDSRWKKIGRATTNGAGAYVFHKRLAKLPRYVFAGVNFYYRTGCDQPSSAPGGCASETVDTTFAHRLAKVPQPKKH